MLTFADAETAVTADVPGVTNGTFGVDVRSVGGVPGAYVFVSVPVSVWFWVPVPLAVIVELKVLPAKVTEPGAVAPVVVLDTVWF